MVVGGTPHLAAQVAEALYNKGFMSYPRTETDKFNRDTDLKALIGLHVRACLDAVSDSRADRRHSLGCFRSAVRWARVGVGSH